MVGKGQVTWVRGMNPCPAHITSVKIIGLGQVYMYIGIWTTCDREGKIEELVFWRVGPASPANGVRGLHVL